jgi:hypothetical protein
LTNDHLQAKGPSVWPNMRRADDDWLGDRCNCHRRRCAYGRGNLDAALVQQGMGNIVERFSVVMQPLLLVGHNALKERDCGNDGQIDDVEPQQWRARVECKTCAC